MAQRGMLPKIRKTAQGVQPVARPTIRPVRVSKAPPPPAPPRRFPSGVAPRGSHEAHDAHEAHAAHESPEPTTRNGYEDPPTMSAHGAPIPAPRSSSAAPPASSVRFDDETQMRSPDGRLIAASRHPERLVDDETWAREAARSEAAPATVPHFPPANDAHYLRPLPAPQQPDLYDSLPSLEFRRPLDTYEAEFAERDPATQYGGRNTRERDAREHDDGEHYRAPRRDEPPTHQTPYDRQSSEPSMPAPAPAREGSGARERPRKNAQHHAAYADSEENRVPSYRQQAQQQQQHPHHEPAPSPVRAARISEPARRHADPIIPPAPRVPAGFIVGVQPIRTPPGGGHAAFPVEHDSYPNHAGPPTAAPPRAMHAPMHAPVHAPAHAPMHAMQQSPRAHQHHAMPYAQPAYRPQQMMATHPPARGMQPVGHQLQDPPPSASSKTLRFAWFVFGVAFGIGFTFFASGVVPGLKREEPAVTAAPAPSATFPPPAPILSNAPRPVQAPPVAVTPPPYQAARPVQASPPVMTPPVGSVNQLPPGVTANQPQQPQPATSAQAQAQKQQPQAAPAPPPAPRVAVAPRAAPRRPARGGGGGGEGPRALPNSGSVEAPDSEGAASSSSSSSAAGAAAPAAAKTASADVPKDLFGAALNP